MYFIIRVKYSNKIFAVLFVSITPRVAFSSGHCTVPRSDCCSLLTKHSELRLNSSIDIEITEFNAGTFTECFLSLQLPRVTKTGCRRDKKCKGYMCKMEDLNHPFHPLLRTCLDDICPYKSDQLYFYKNFTTCRTKCTEDFFSFKYF